MVFQSPGYLFLLLLLIPVIGWYIWEMRKSDASMQVSSTGTLQRQPKTLRLYLLHIPFVLRCAAVILLSIALARPQLTNSWRSESTEGIDIMMALDISGTMQAEDLRPNRLEAAKNVASEFIMSRPNDNIGLVVFAGESFCQCPLTTDHAVLINLFKSVKFGMIDDGTAIGDGLATAINRLKDSEAVSKVIILLTDGMNNSGSVDPYTAAEMAKLYGIRVYTVGVGSYGTAPFPVQTIFGVQYQQMKVEIDEKLLTTIANSSGGKYFRATSNQKLDEIYDEIDKLERSKIEVMEFKRLHEEFYPLVAWAIALLLLEFILRRTVFRTISE